jgi:N-acetylneuraminic acid mutarotase
MELFRWKEPLQNKKTLYKGRSGHTAIHHQNKLYFFLGETSSKLITNTIIIFDIKKEEWSLVGTHMGPSCRRSHTTSKKDDKVLFFSLT